MGNDNRRDSSGSAILTVLVLGVALLLVTGLAVAGAVALWLMRTHAQQSQAIAEQQYRAAEVIHDRLDAERDREMAALADAERSGGQAELLTEHPTPRPAGKLHRTISVRIDRDGNTTLDGHAVDADKVKRLLEKASDNARMHLDVQIHADRRCDFEHLVAITSACESLGIADIRFRVLAEGDTPQPP